MDKMIILCFFFNSSIYFYIILLRPGSSVGIATENRCVGGSIPPWAPRENKICTNAYLIIVYDRLQIRL